MKLIIARHGETDYNIKRLIQGQKDSTLTERGVNQATSLGKELKAEKIDRIYSSPMSRCLKTAEIVNAHHDVEIIKLDILKERSFGILEDKPGVYVDRQNPGCLKDPLFRPDKGESVEDVFNRVSPFMRRLFEEQKKGKKIILIVAHKVVNQCILATILRKDFRKMYLEPQDHCSLNMIKVRKDRVELQRFNDTEHLKDSGIEILQEIKGIC